MAGATKEFLAALRKKHGIGEFAPKKGSQDASQPVKVAVKRRRSASRARGGSNEDDERFARPSVLGFTSQLALAKRFQPLNDPE